MKKSKLFYILSADVVVAGVALVILVLLTFTGSIMRYFFNSPIIWQEEVQLGLAVWVIFLGGGVAFRYSGHVAIDMLVDRFPKKVQKVVEFFIAGVTLAMLFFLMTRSSALITQLAETHRTTNILHIPSQFIYSAVPVGCFLMIVNYIIFELKVLFNIDLLGIEEGE